VVTAVLAGRLPQMSLAASLRSLFYPSDIPAAYAALDRFDLGEKLFERVDRLSGGERQRVGLARALLAPARLWLIDEPLSALDPTRSRQAIGTLVDEARARGVTLVATLHQVEVALAHFPRVLGLRDGQLAFDLAPQEVTRERLERLYAQHEDELRGAPPAISEQPDNGPRPAAMHCR
jgi:phosphonate transport system ATP-binding protein